MKGPYLSGALFRHILQELEAITSHTEVWKAVGALTEDERAECLDILAIRWVHASTSVELVKAVARRLRRRERELHDLVIARATERVFTTIWRVIFNFVSAEAMVLRVPVIFNRTYRGIRTEAGVIAPGQAFIHIRDWPEIDDLSLHGIAVSTAVALRVAAKHEVAIATERVPDGARYVVSWKA